MRHTKLLSLFLALSLLASSLAVPAAAETQAPATTESVTAETTTAAETGSAETASTEAVTSGSTPTGKLEGSDAVGGPLNPASSILTAANPEYKIELETTSTACLMVDENSRTILYAENENEKVYPASTTKIMTALLVLEAIDRGELSLDTVVTVTEEANADITSDSSTQDISTGEEITVENLLYCLLVASANESANILAIAVSGSVSNFVALMNQRAAELGCTGTHYMNPHGLHNNDHYTTCTDLYLITETAWQNETFRTIVGTDEYYVPATNLHEERHLLNTNLMLSEKKSSGYLYPYTVGVKTGTTYYAGSCLVSAAEYEGRLVFSVVMGCKNYIDDAGTVHYPVYTQSSQMFRRAFVDFHSVTLAKQGDLLTQVDVTLGQGTDFVLVSPAEDASLDLVCGLEAEDFEQVFHLPDSVSAPVTAGDVVGTMDIVYNGTVYATVDLVAVSDVALSVSEQMGNSVHSFFNSPIVKGLIITLCILIVALVALLASALTRRNRERYRGKRRSSHNAPDQRKRK